LERVSADTERGRRLHAATIFAGLPDPFRAGGPLTHWALIGALVTAGHRVTFVSLPWESAPAEEGVEAVRSLGAKVALVSPPARSEGRWRARGRYLRSILWPGDETLFSMTASPSDVAPVMEELRPDALVAHGTPAVAAAAALEVPKLALVGDPPGLSRRLRVRWDPQYPWRLGRDELLYRLGSATFALRADHRFEQVLRRFDSVGIFGANHADSALRRRVRAWYASSPVVDSAGPEWRSRRAAFGPNAKPRILLIGHLRGISTICGLHVFVEHVLPELTERLGPQGFEAHVVGAHDPPGSLADALRHPAVALRGQVQPPDEEFLRADVLLVPSPIEWGERTRIVAGFSFGCCVVAHVSSRLGMPALEHGVNALLADSAGLAEETLQALADRKLRERLGDAGRRLYEAQFTPERAGGRIVAEVERIAAARK
jgi:glycosyltransferase involved in cell wall biosynthesis